MKVRLDEIPSEGRDFFFTDRGLNPRELGEQVSRVLEPPQAEIHASRVGDRVQLEGRFKTLLMLVCGRCTDEYQWSVEGPVAVTLTPAPVDAPDELHLAADELEVEFYQGDEIDLAQVVREEIGLALPIAAVCRPDCPGLCPVCGQNLAQGSCRCQDEESDPRWAKLSQLKLD